MQGKDRYPTCSIMVWAGIMINGRTRLHVVVNETMTGQRYIDEVLLPRVRLFRGAVGDKFVFMDDNATYLNPIVNVWDAFRRQVSGRNYPLTNKNTLIRALTEEWDKLPQQLLDNVVQRRRIAGIKNDTEEKKRANNPRKNIALNIEKNAVFTAERSSTFAKETSKFAMKEPTFEWREKEKEKKRESLIPHDERRHSLSPEK
ncbi:transposable element Tc1 transposase [Trichonephila clavipes]|nr:transposable element Tc1 transposase [Trichonephila clavipes]